MVSSDRDIGDGKSKMATKQVSPVHFPQSDTVGSDWELSEEELNETTKKQAQTKETQKKQPSSNSVSITSTEKAKVWSGSLL